MDISENKIDASNNVDVNVDVDVNVNIDVKEDFNKIVKFTLLEHIYYASLVYECPDKLKDTTHIGEIKIQDSDKKKETYKAFINDFSPSGEILTYGSNTRDVQYAIVRNDDTKSLSLVFRGSESILDWYHDFLISKKSIPGNKNVKVHKGFYLQLFNENLYQKIERKLIEYKKQYSDYQLYICGHSAGAALATLFSFLFSFSINVVKNKNLDHINKQIICITFASPRVGNYAFQQLYNKNNNIKHLRCYNHRDIICAFPNYKYYHVGHGIKINKDTVKIFKNINNKKQYIHSIFKFWKINDHHSETYCNRIKNNEYIFI